MKKHYYFLIVILFFITGCIGYNRISYDGYRILRSPEMAENIDKNDIYIHDKDSSYRILSPKIADSVIYGSLEVVESKSKIDSLKNQDLKLKKKDQQLYAVNIYTSKSLKSTQDSLNRLSLESLQGSTDKKIPESATHTTQPNYLLHLSDVEKADAYASDSNRAGMIILIVVGAILTAGLVIWLLIIALTKGAEASGEASTESSNESSAESSGGEDGSCYIATMSYGSYDAPEVIVLRSFRDRFLKRFYLGQMFISFYYKHAPKFVNKHQKNYRIHKAIRAFLNGFVFLLKKLNF